MELSKLLRSNNDLYLLNLKVGGKMNKNAYNKIKKYMESCMEDSAHDKEHIYRVLYIALDIAKNEKNVDYDVLIASCLLHDIGRKEQAENPTICHAQIGSEKAYRFLISCNWSDKKANHVKECILTHRFRSNNPPNTLEGKILFDSDKIDATGTIGIARTLIYSGQTFQPLYTLLDDGTISYDSNDLANSFFKEYKYKLERLYSNFHTARGKEIAMKRQRSAIVFFDNLLLEVESSYTDGLSEFKRIIDEGLFNK